MLLYLSVANVHKKCQYLNRKDIFFIIQIFFLDMIEVFSLHKGFNSYVKSVSWHNFLFLYKM